jgi:hypothetical protein
MINIIISFIPFVFAQFAREKVSKYLIYSISIITSFIYSICILLFNANHFVLSLYSLGSLMGATIGMSFFSIISTFVFGYLFRNSLK